jgi:hypothetical protein
MSNPDLNIEEEELRSLDSDSRSNVSNLLDNTELRVIPEEPVIPDEYPGFLNPGTGKSVPFLNIPGTHVKDKGAGDFGNHLDEFLSDQQNIYPGDQPRSKEGIAMARGDIDSSDYSGTTHTLHLSRQIVNYPPRKSAMQTRVNGLTGQSHEPRGTATQRLPAMIHHGADGTRVQMEMNEDLLNLQFPSAPNPKPVEKTGGVKLKWGRKESLVVEQLEEISPEQSRLRDLQALNKEEPEIEKALLDGLEQANRHFKTRNRFLKEGSNESAAVLREYLMKPHSEGGTIMKSVLLDPDLRKTAQLSSVDLATRVQEGWALDWEACERGRMPEAMGMAEVQQIIVQASVLLERNTPELLRAMGEDHVRELLERHQMFSEGLVGVEEVSEDMEKIMPEEKVDSIMEWYVRLVAGLEEVDRQRAKMVLDVQALWGHIQEYPGPRLALRGGPSRSRGVTVAYAGAPRDRMEEQMLEPRMSDSRLVQQARQLGGVWREGGAPFPETSDHFGATTFPEKVNTLSGGLVRSQLKRGSGNSGSGSKVTSISSYSNSEAPTGFDGDDLPTIKAELHTYVGEQLATLGKGNPETIAIIMDNFPRLGFTSKGKGHEIRDFLKMSKMMTVKLDGDYISVAEWWKKLNKNMNDFCWSLSIRVIFISRHGGLPDKAPYLAIRTRVITLMEEITKWMPDFDDSKSESNGHYWLYVWIRVGLKLIEEFHQNQSTTKVEEGVKEFMMSERFLIEPVDNALNNQFHKVDQLYKATNAWLRERSSGLVDSPLYVWKLVGEWLKNQTPWGQYMMQHIDKALNKLGSDPRLVFPEGHWKTEEDIQEIKRKGAAGATEEVYGLILTQLKHRAANDDLAIELKTIPSMEGAATESGGGWVKAGAKSVRRTSKAMSVTTDFSSLTMNTHYVKGDGGSRFTLCRDCSLFHEAGVCPFWDKSKKKFNSPAFFKHRSVREIKEDGSSQISEYWIKKLYQFAFPKMSITAKATQEQIIKDLRALATKQPKASKEEIQKFAERQSKFVNLAEMEEKSHISLLKTARDNIVNAVAVMLARKSKTKSKNAARAERRRKAREEEESESSSDSDSDSDDSDFSARS